MAPIKFPTYSGATPTEGQLLAYNAATGLWEPRTIGGASPASPTSPGPVKISKAAADPANPVAVETTDSRLSNARAPTAHKASHASGGPDPLSPADIGAAAGSHLHDDRYHTETEANTLLSGKSDAAHLHDDRYFNGVQDHGMLETFRAILNFTGAGVSVIDDGASGRVNVDIPGGGTGSSVQVQEEDAAAFAARPVIRFVGTGVTATEDAVNNRVNVDVPGGGTGEATNASATQKGVARLSAAPSDPADPVAAATNDPRIPTTDENEAMLGTSGAPSTTNRYLTDGDPRNSNARAPTTHTHDNATQAAPGFQSVADKTKLDGLSGSAPPKDYIPFGFEKAITIRVNPYSDLIREARTLTEISVTLKTASTSGGVTFILRKNTTQVATITVAQGAVVAVAAISVAVAVGDLMTSECTAAGLNATFAAVKTRAA